MKDLKTVIKVKNIIKDFAEDTNCGVLVKDDKIFVIDPECEFFANDYDEEINPKYLGAGIKTLEEYGKKLKMFGYDPKNIVLAAAGYFDMSFLHKEFIKKMSKINSMLIPVDDLNGTIETIVVYDYDEPTYAERSIKELENEISEKCPGKIKFILQSDFDKLWDDSTKPYED